MEKYNEHFGRNKQHNLNYLDVTTLAENLVGKDAATIEKAILGIYLLTSEGAESEYLWRFDTYLMPDKTTKKVTSINFPYSAHMSNEYVKEWNSKYGFSIPIKKGD